MFELAARGFLPVALKSDVREAQALKDEVATVVPTWVVHTAAMTNVAECEKNPDAARAINGEGTVHVIDAARAVGARVIYISTASVFKGDKGDYTEEDQPEPTNVYNQTKVEGESAALRYERAMVLRLNLVGIHPNGSRGRNFLEWLVDTIGANKDLTLFNDQRVNALSNWTIARLIVQCIKRDIHESVLHIGTSDVVSKAGFAKLVLAHCPEYRGVVSEMSVDSIGDGAVRPKEMWLNTDKASRLFGPMPTAAEEVELILSKARAKVDKV